MSTSAVPSLAVPTPLGVPLVAPAPRAMGPSTSRWREGLRIAGRVIAACGDALAAGFAISLGVAAAFLLIAVVAS